MSASPMLLLGLAIVGLALGPAVALGVARIERWRQAIELGSLVVVASFCLAFVLPHAFEHIGPAALVAAVVGLMAPTLVERGLQGRLALTMTLTVLAVHTALDGAALALADDGGTLAGAIVAHRMPVGLAVATAASRAASTPASAQALTWAITGALCAATVAGFVGGGAVAASVSPTALGWLEGLVAGALLHVVSAHRGLLQQAPVAAV